MYEYTELEQLSVWKLTRKERLLVRAALYRGPTSLEAWHNLENTEDLDGFGRGAINVFPELYLSLKEQGVNHRLVPRLKGVYKHTWTRNQVMFARVEQVLREFATRGIPAILLKGAALAVRYYDDVGGRFMLDVDLMVPYEQVPMALRALLDMRWRPAEFVPEPVKLLFRMRHGVSFKAPSDWVSLDLHWNALHLSLGPCADTAFWDSRVPVRFRDVDAFALNPTDQLFQVLGHACNWWVPSPVCWVRDALIMIRNANEYPIEWPRLDAAAHEHRLNVGIYEKLQYLRDHFAVDIPGFVCRSGGAYFHQRIEASVFSRRPPYGALGFCLLTFMTFLRLPTEFRAEQGILAFPRFLQYRLKCRRLRDVPAAFLRMLRKMNRFKREFRRHQSATRQQP
jgi:Uncharacterised nucleotidyltransferase